MKWEIGEGLTMVEIRNLLLSMVLSEVDANSKQVKHGTLASLLYENIRNFETKIGNPILGWELSDFLYFTETHGGFPL